MSGLIQDLRYATRTLLRQPGFLIFAVLIIGIGVGANTAVFSVMSPLMLRPLPFENPDELVWVAHSSEGGMSAVTSRTSNLRDYRAMNESFEQLTGYFAFFDYESYNLLSDGEPRRLVGVGIAHDFLGVLGVVPEVGRSFTEEEGLWGASPVVILTNRLWKERYEGDPTIVGQTINLNDEATVVVGVLPSTFDFSSTFTPAVAVDFLRPFPIADETDQWGNTLAIIGRLRDGVTPAMAQADIDLMTGRLQEADPARWGLGAVVSPLQEQIAGSFRSGLLLLAAAAGAVMLIACANLSNLLLARGRGRGREMAVRSAMGADRMRLVRQLGMESLLLALVGGFAGVIIAFSITTLISGASAVSIPLLQSAKVDGAALGFTLTLAVGSGLLMGLMPAFQISESGAAAAFSEARRGSTAGRGSARVREALVIGEVALASILLVGGGLMLKSFVTVLDVDLGFRPEGAMLWRVDTTRPFDTREGWIAFYDQLVASVESVPGVEEVGLTDTTPLGRNRSWGLQPLGPELEPGQQKIAFPRMIDHRYLSAMRIPLLAGRSFGPDDTPESVNVMVLNESAAEDLFPGEDPIGRTVLVAGGEWQVVGVAADVRHQSLEQAGGAEFYLPVSQSPDVNTLEMVVRTTVAPSTVVPGVRATLRNIDPTMPTDDFRTLSSLVDRAVSPRRFILLLLGSFSATALLLAALGIYAVLSYTVSQRTSEIGIRMALGESVTMVRRRIVARTIMLAAIGIGIGAMASFVATRFIRSLLFGVAPTDFMTFAGMAAVLLLVSAAAGYLPARKASSTDPIEALRSA